MALLATLEAPYHQQCQQTIDQNHLHRESKGATLTMAITLSILSLLQRAVNFQQNQY